MLRLARPQSGQCRGMKDLVPRVQGPAVSATFGIKLLITKAKPSPPESTMRQERTVQASIFDLFAEHEIGRELKAMS